MTANAAPDSLASRTIRGVGQTVSWLCLAMVLLTFFIVILRYGFSLGRIWLQELVTYLHAGLFMLAAAWTLQDDRHVRVDIFYRDASPRARAWVNLLGSLVLLLPVCVYLLITAWPYVFGSWRLLEGSREAGGLPAVFLLKTLIILMPALLGAQGVLLVLSSLDEIRGQGTST